MTTLTIRIDEQLKSKAFEQASKLGIPVTLVVKMALKNFVQSGSVVIGDPKTVSVTPDVQEKMDAIADVL